MKRKILAIVSIALSLLMLCSCSLIQKDEDDGDKLFFHLNKLPDIGSYKSRDKVSYFSENGAESSFAPRSDYGEIVPFVYRKSWFGKSESEDGERYFGYEHNSFGFATIDGKIITGGIYEDVSTRKLSDGQTVFIASKLRTNHDGETSEDLWAYRSDCDIIASDGSWTVRCSKGFYSISDGGYICTADENGNGLVYDFNGNLIFDAMQLLGEEVLVDLYYADMGKCVIRAYKSSAFFDYHEVQRFTQYAACIGPDGEVIYDLQLDGWEIENYVDGRFIIRNNETYRYALCDLYGEKLVTKLDRLQYDQATNSFIGYISDPNKDQKNSLWIKYDMNGEELASFEVPHTEIYGPEILSSDSLTAAVCVKDSYASTDLYKLEYWIDFKNEKIVPIDFDYTEAQILYSYFSYADDGYNAIANDSLIAFKADGAYDIYAIDGTYLKTLDDVNGNDISIENGFICYKTPDAPADKFRFRSLTGRTDLEVENPFDNDEYGTYYSIYGDYIAFKTYSNDDFRHYIKLFNIRENKFEGDNNYLDFLSVETANGYFYCAIEPERAYLLNSDLEVIISLSFHDYA